MANKFQRSVQERLQKEAQRTPPKADESHVEQIAVSVDPSLQQIEPMTSTKPALAQDISAYLRPEKDRTAKNKTFYLDTEVIEALHSAAKRAGITDSRLCNDILRTVLGLNQ